MPTPSRHETWDTSLQGHLLFLQSLTHTVAIVSLYSPILPFSGAISNPAANPQRVILLRAILIQLSFNCFMNNVWNLKMQISRTLELSNACLKTTHIKKTWPSHVPAFVLERLIVSGFTTDDLQGILGAGQSELERILELKVPKLPPDNITTCCGGVLIFWCLVHDWWQNRVQKPGCCLWWLNSEETTYCLQRFKCNHDLFLKY